MEEVVNHAAAKLFAPPECSKVPVSRAQAAPESLAKAHRYLKPIKARRSSPGSPKKKGSEGSCSEPCARKL